MNSKRPSKWNALVAGEINVGAAPSSTAPMTPFAYGADASTGGADASTGGSNPEPTCPLPTTFEWTSTGPLAEPSSPGATGLKDFSVTRYNDKYIVFGTLVNGDYNGFFSTFSSFDEWDTAEQHVHSGHSAPTLLYFEPQDLWVLAYQWDFQFKTTQTPDVWSSWSAPQPLLSGDPTTGEGTGPMSQTIICDDESCYLFFVDGAGGLYRGSMSINDFPGTFSGATAFSMNPSRASTMGCRCTQSRGATSTS